MAIRNFGGFEHGLPASLGPGAGDFADSEGTLARGSIETAGQHDGLRCFRSEDVAGNFQGFRFGAAGPSGQNLGITGAAYFYVWIKVNDFGANSGTIIQFGLGYLKLQVSESGIRFGGQDETTTVTLTEGQWHLVRMRFDLTNTDGYLSVDGGSEVGPCGLHSATLDAFHIGLSDGMFQNDVEFDTWVIADAALDFDPHCVRLGPDGAGNSSGWSGSYTDVDEIEQDNDSTYLSTSSSGVKHDVTLESSSTAGVVGAIKAVKTLAVCRDEGGAANVETYVRVGSTDYEQNEGIDPGTNYWPVGTVLELNPATSAAWVASDLDGLGVGVKSNAAVATRVTTLGVMVLTDGVAGSPSEQISYGWFNDDGSESASTLKATQGTDPASMIAGDTVRVRIQTDTNGVDPPTRAAKLQYRRVGVSAWRDVPLA